MKTLITILALVLALGAASCDKKEITPPHIDGTSWNIKLISGTAKYRTIQTSFPQQSDWVVLDKNIQYTVSYDGYISIEVECSGSCAYTVNNNNYTYSSKFYKK